MRLKKLSLLCAVLLMSQGAWAEEGGASAANAQPENGGEAASTWKVTVGGGVASTPRFEGAAKNRLRAVPLLEIDNGHFFASTTRGLGYNFSDDKATQYGLRMNWSPYRKQTADPHLNGLGDLGFGIEGGAFYHTRFDQWYVTSSAAAGNHGAHIDLGGGYEFKLSPTDQLRTGLELTWANNKYMQTYFGVTAAQSAASGGVLPVYSANSGIKDYALKANWTHAYTKEWFSNAGLTVKQLSGSAKNSPVTQRQTGTSASFVVGYRF